MSIPLPLSGKWYRFEAEKIILRKIFFIWVEWVVQESFDRDEVREKKEVNLSKGNEDVSILNKSFPLYWFSRRETICMNINAKVNENILHHLWEKSVLGTY